MDYEGGSFLRTLGRRLMKAPPGWPFGTFGNVSRLGWIAGLGGGRWSDEFPEAVAFQSRFRACVAQLMKVEPGTLVQKAWLFMLRRLSSAAI